MRTSLLDGCLGYLRLERGLAASTVATYGNHLRGYLRFLDELGESPASATRATASAYIGSLRSRGLRPATVYCAGMAVAAFYGFLKARGLVEENPASELELPRLSSRVAEPLSPADVERLLDAPSPRSFCGLRDRAILEFLYCGLRIGEAMALAVADVHLMRPDAPLIDLAWLEYPLSAARSRSASSPSAPCLSCRSPPSA